MSNSLCIFEHDEQILPIEVKSGKDYEKHSALDHILKDDELGIREALVFTNGRLTYYPIYMTMFLQENNMDFIDISIDKYKL